VGDVTLSGGSIAIGDLYADREQAWASGAELVYRPLARALVAMCPVAPVERRWLDAGAGTGAGSWALRGHGADVVALDLVWSMLNHDRAHRPPGVVGDLYHLPVRRRAFGAVLAPFVLNHVDRPVEVLRGLAGCVEPGGVILASTFSERDRPRVKDLVDEVAAAYGCRPPESYQWMRTATAPLLGSEGAMADAAQAAGLVEVEVVEMAVDTGVARPADQVAYRFGMPHLSRFLDGLAPGERAAVVAEAVARVAADGDTDVLDPTVVFLSARSG
jgi:ubiquinone/menaquinone biosynthesis C-methylase UbiE